MAQPASLLTTGEAAARIGISDELVRRLARDGRLRSLRLPSGHRRFHTADVDRFVVEHTNEEVA